CRYSAQRVRCAVSVLPLLLYCSGPPRVLHSFPTRRSSDLRQAFGDADEFDVAAPRREPVLAGQLPAVHLCGLAAARVPVRAVGRSEEHTSELQSRENLVCRLLLEKKKQYSSEHADGAVETA